MTKSDFCLRLSSKAHCSSTRIYNIIRAVGRGELTADNALHQLVEDYHDLRQLGNDLIDLAKQIEHEEWKEAERVMGEEAANG